MPDYVYFIEFWCDLKL